MPTRRQNGGHGSSSRRTAGPARRPHRRRRRHRRLLRPRARPAATLTSRSSSAPPAIAARAWTRRSTICTSPRPPRRSWSTAPSQGITGPLFIGKDTHALSQPAWTTAIEVLVANGVTSAPRTTTTTPPPRRSPGRSWCTTQTAAPGQHRRRHRGHPVAQPAPRRRLQVQPAARRAGRHRRHQRDRRPGERVDGRPVGDQAQGATTRSPATSTASTTSATTARTWSTRSTCKAVREAGVHIGADPMGGASVQYWDYIAEQPRHRPDGDQPRGRPAAGRS